MARFATRFIVLFESQLENAFDQVVRDQSFASVPQYIVMAELKFSFDLLPSGPFGELFAIDLHVVASIDG